MNKICMTIRQQLLHYSEPDVWNQEMYVIQSQQGPPLKDL